MVFSVIVPIFILLFLGYISVKVDLINKVQITALSAFIIKIALPALLLHALSSKDLHEIWYPEYFLVYAGVAIFLFALSFYLGLKLFKNTMTETSVLSMGAAMSNTGLLGTAVLTLLMGNQATIYISLIVILESVLVVPTVLVLAELGLQKQSNYRAILKNTVQTLFKNPLFLAVMLGMSCAIFQIKLPQQVDQVLALIGQTASPLALFVIGGGVVGLSVRYINAQSIYLVISKNVVMPLLVFVGLSTFTHVSQEMIYAGTLIAALPMPSIFGILGQVYGLNEKALTPLMLSTILGFAVISTLITLWW
ncbi:AEC family transporter [Acinetobacter sp. ANC 4648]|uniref:AEC family transporter n=1 Tax=Acinetobacter sp. ANC 4648 TaxID=1977875 RepID=UPI000A34DEF8|nr:AEC family transporter [Acinetobacter sp. ANC 4648]OTG83940.1 transporter [Acinetobacter sp. ANC 4648]